VTTTKEATASVPHTDDITADLLELVDLIATARLRQMSADLSEGEDWGQVAGSIARSRVARNIRADGYQPLERTPKPWPLASLDRATWVDGAVA
jgi:hypothetical protein